MYKGGGAVFPVGEFGVPVEVAAPSNDRRQEPVEGGGQDGMVHYRAYSQRNRVTAKYRATTNQMATTAQPYVSVSTMPCP